MKETRAARAARAYDQYIPLAEDHATAAAAAGERRLARRRERERARRRGTADAPAIRTVQRHPKYRALARTVKRLRERVRELRLALTEDGRRALAAYVKAHSCAETVERNRTRARVRSRRAKLPAPTRPEPEVCESCGGWSHRALHLDHNHATDKFRGWLCQRCNIGIGHFCDDPVRLRAAADYLERNKT